MIELPHGTEYTANVTKRGGRARGRECGSTGFSPVDPGRPLGRRRAIKAPLALSRRTIDEVRLVERDGTLLIANIAHLWPSVGEVPFPIESDLRDRNTPETGSSLVHRFRAISGTACGPNRLGRGRQGRFPGF